MVAKYIPCAVYEHLDEKKISPCPLPRIIWGSCSMVGNGGVHFAFRAQSLFS